MKNAAQYKFGPSKTLDKLTLKSAFSTVQPNIPNS